MSPAASRQRLGGPRTDGRPSHTRAGAALCLHRRADPNRASAKRFTPSRRSLRRAAWAPAFATTTRAEGPVSDSRLMSASGARRPRATQVAPWKRLVGACAFDSIVLDAAPHEGDLPWIPQAQDLLQHQAWNFGRIIGPKPPLKPRHIWAIRTRLQHDGRVRDLAMFNLAIDSKLRGCDLVRLPVGDVILGGTGRLEPPSFNRRPGGPYHSN